MECWNVLLLFHYGWLRREGRETTGPVVFVCESAGMCYYYFTMAGAAEKKGDST